MHIYSVINSTLELTCLAITAAFMLSLLLTRANKTSLSRILLLMLAAQCGVLLFDVVAWAFAMRTEPYIRPLLLVANFMVYALGYLMPLLIAYYLVTYIAGRYPDMPHRKGIVLAVTGSAGVMEVLLVISQFTGGLYYLDERNVYMLGPLSLLSQLYSIVFMVANAAILLRYRGHLARRDIRVMLMFFVIPIIGTAAELLVNDYIMFLNLSATIAYIVLYVSLQVRQEMQAVETETSLRTSIMLSQIQPHFLYNTLNTIGDMCASEPELAQETVFEFSDYLRGNMDSLTSPNMVPFDKELSHVETYLSLEKKRFEDQLFIRYDIRARDFLLPPLTIQPIVENAVLHGITERSGKGLLQISTEETKSGVVITIADDGVGFDAATLPGDGKTHVGIDNVRKRLAAICGGTLTVASAPGKGTTVTMLIPREGIV
ncbi:histidine kinase [Clostridia bacterium OttesenSCG-928-O13]|nr:histidine kinase [Clostridia bacterium OttesenSCG-928-O13]